jgi:hypothetical protein
MGAMAKKKKKRFDVTKAVKAVARERIGTVPPTKQVPAKKRETPEKHRRTLEELMDE